MKTIIFTILLFLVPMIGFSEEKCITEEDLQSKVESKVKEAVRILGESNVTDKQKKEILEIIKKRLKNHYTLRGIDVKSDCGIYI